jgi:hypothetical protein
MCRVVPFRLNSPVFDHICQYKLSVARSACRILQNMHLGASDVELLIYRKESWNKS